MEKCLDKSDRDLSCEANRKERFSRSIVNGCRRFHRRHVWYVASSTTTRYLRAAGGSETPSKKSLARCFSSAVRQTRLCLVAV